MNAHDLQYEKLRECFENGELTDPILSRAFRETKPDPAPQLQAALEAAEARLRACEEQMRATEAHRLQDAGSHREDLSALRREHSREIKTRELRIVELEHEKPELRRVKWDDGERERIERMGWVKSAAD